MSRRYRNKPDHFNGCDCFECAGNPRINKLMIDYSKANYVNATGRKDHADKISKPASYFIGSTLVARKPVTLLKSPSDSGTPVISFPKGANVGKIAMYVVKDGFVWWEIDFFSGKPAGWIKHDPKLFDGNVAEQTASGTEHEKAMEELNKINTEKNALEKLGDGFSNALGGIGDFVGGIGGNLKMILLIVIIIGVLYAFMKLKKE